jgi:hypothetical protein
MSPLQCHIGAALALVCGQSRRAARPPEVHHGGPLAGAYRPKQERARWRFNALAATRLTRRPFQAHGIASRATSGPNYWASQPASTPNHWFAKINP